MASMPHVRVPVVVRAGDRKPGHGFYILTRELADDFKLRMQGIASTADISRQSMQSAGYGR